MMSFLLVWVILSALVWLAVLLLPWQPWRNHLTLPAWAGASAAPNLADVTVVIPARNEAQVIGQTVAALAEQGQGLQVILVDDNSTDGTADCARQVIVQTVADLNLRILPGRPLPVGWSGKLWALHQGVQQVQTTLTLLIDADIALGPGVVAALKAEKERRGVQMISIMASLHMQSFWEKLLMPAFIYFFKMLYPFGPANSDNPRFASAAGGCILLETSLFSATGGLESIRSAVIDDCTLAAQVKQAGFRTWIGQSRRVNCIRPYEGLHEIWNMVARTAYTQLGYSPLLLGLCTFGLVTLFWLPLAGLLAPSGDVRLAGLLACVGMALTYLPTLRFYSLSPAWALLFPLAGSLYLGMTWTSALRYWRGERSRWKGRVYAAS